MSGYAAEHDIQDGGLNFEEACAHVSGQKLQGPETKPIKSDRALGTVQISDLPIRHLEASPAKIEQFADILMGYQIDFTPGMFDQIYKLCYEDKYGQLPEPFSLVKAPLVPYTIQFVILPASVPQDADPNRSYYHIVKHVYLHRNKLSSKDCVAMCRGTPMRFEWGNSVRLGLAALNYMMDGMGGQQLRHWIIKPKYEKKLTIDQQQRSAGYEFIRNFGPRCNNRNQFMEWTDEQIHTPGGKLENWPESKVKEALSNYMKGRQNAKTLEFWPFTLKTFIPWFLNRVLTPMLPTMRQHAITWIGRTRTGKSLGSKTILFMQSKYEINEADRSDLVPSVVTAKHLDFFKAEPLTRFKPGVFDDGMLQRMDSSFLKAFLNPSASRLMFISLMFFQVFLNYSVSYLCTFYTFVYVEVVQLLRRKTRQYGPGIPLLNLIKGPDATRATTRMTKTSTRNSTTP